MTKCIMKKNWTCSAGALELTLASCFIRQFMRLIVHFYSELTSNHHRVFVITSFAITCGIWSFTVVKMLFIAFYIAAKIRISDVHIHLKKITHKPYPIVIVCLLSYIIYSGCCHVYFCCVACSGWNSRCLWCYRLSVLKLPGIHSKYNTH